MRHALRLAVRKWRDPMTHARAGRSGYRWIVLASYVAMIFVDQIYVVNFAPLITTVAARYGVTEGHASLLLFVFPAIYVLCSIPAGLLADRRGFRAAIGLGAVLQIVFSAVRIDDASFAALLIGQVGLAVAQPLILNGISKLVVDWFDEHEAALATGIATVGMFAGMAFGLATTPALVSSIGLRGTMAVHAGLALAAGGVFFVWGRERGAVEHKRPREARSGLKVLLANRDLRLLVAIVFLGLGVFNAFVTWLEPIVAPRGIDAGQAGLIGGALIMGGIAGAVVVPAVSARAARRKPFLLASVAVSTALFGAFAGAGAMLSLTVIATCLGFCFLGAFPLILEMCAHHAGAARAATATSLLMLAGNAGGVAVIVALPALKGNAPTYASGMVLLVGLMVIATALSSLLAETLRPGAAPAGDAPRTVLHALRSRAATGGAHPALWRRHPGGYRPLSWRAYADLVERFALGLEALGFRDGECLAILGPNREEWLAANLGAMALGGVGVGIYTSSSDDQLAYVLAHCEARQVVVLDAKAATRVLALRGASPLLERIIVIEPGPLAASQDGVEVIAFAEVVERGTGVDRARYIAHLDALRPDRVATLIYTSGTTGPPKGIMLDHRALDRSARALHESLALEAREVFVSYLPLSHIAEQLSTIYGPILFGAEVYFAESLDRIAANLAEARPTSFFGVPRLWEGMQRELEARFASLPARVQRGLAWARRVALARNLCVLEDGRVPLRARAQYAVARRILQPVKARLGFGRAHLVTSSAAPIGRHTLEFFASLDLVLRELYGQSEVAGATSANTLQTTRFGTVGRPLPGLELRTADDGEILVRGETHCVGYYKDPAATAELIVDGWLHTGDLGVVDPGGFLRIVGRKKETIVLSSGEKAAPGPLEDRLKRIALIEHAVVAGEGRDHLIALVTLEPARAAALAGERGWPAHLATLATDPRFIDHLQRRIADDVNAHVAAHERIEGFCVLPVTFTIAGGELTPTLKVKREIVLRTWQAQADALFDGSRTPARSAARRNEQGNDAAQRGSRQIDGGLDDASDVG
jgi:long-chain acyl-CoA synthetase